MSQSLPVKKQLSLHWSGVTLDLDVAQELFSSHQIDRGSKMLLSSLESLEVPTNGVAVDFGCGYGVLGIAWQATHSGWSMHYADRDALAVAFSDHNVRRSIPYLADRASYVHDVTPPIPPGEGFGLVLWNVPGKAGADVLKALTAILFGTLGEDGLLAVVVVNPLADALRQVAGGVSEITCVYDDGGREHTVLHFRKRARAVTWRNAFLAGVYDRPEVLFTLGERSWQLTPVIGLPEYDSLSHATALAGDLMVQHGESETSHQAMVLEPGAGHLPVLAATLWPKACHHILSRDALALLSSQRAVQRSCAGSRPNAYPIWGMKDVIQSQIMADIAVVAVPDQVQPDELEDVTEVLESCVQGGGTAIMHGGSTEVGRLERLLRRNRRWRVGKRTKRRGAAAIPIFRGNSP